MEYEFQTKIGETSSVSRGSAFWSNEDGKWRIVHLDVGTRLENPVAISNH